MKIVFTIFIVLLHVGKLLAQKDSFQPDISRALFHQKLDEAQKKLLSRDGYADDTITISIDRYLNRQLTYQITTKINDLQQQIETNTFLHHGQKVAGIRGLSDFLNNFGLGIIRGKYQWNQFGKLLGIFEDAFQLEMKGSSIAPAIQQADYRTARFIVDNIAFSNSVDVQKAKDAVALIQMKEDPSIILKVLSRNPDNVMADSLIKYAAWHMPESLFSFAQASNSPLGKKIADTQDSLVQTIVSLSASNSGQLYFPFLDLLYKNQITKTDIDKALITQESYYKLLVATQLNFAARIAMGDTPVAARGMQQMIKNKSYELYVNVMNGLHERAAPIRFRCIQKLKAEELYYLIVCNEAEIYTSSYLYVYKRMFEVLQSKNSDSLMHSVAYDKYKKFLTIASNYNMLADFLSKMSKESANSLMTDFVNNLDKAKGEDDIEDAVDVANAFAAINQPEIRSLMLAQVNKNLEERNASKNNRGSIVYNIEKYIMESSDDPTINLTDALCILPVYDVNNSFFQDSAGRIILHMFFYGDADGRHWFNELLSRYSNRSNWAFSQSQYWVQFTSLKTKIPFIILANRPLDEKKDLDQLAQDKLMEYMNEKGLEPSITVHRGHSYFLKYTIDQMSPATKVIVLGSCGAYQNLASVLRACPDAYIISSKQVGQGAINIKLYEYMQEKLKEGNDINWANMMKEVGKRVDGSAQDGYDDYVFPHRNLGAIFIKAYRIAMEQEE